MTATQTLSGEAVKAEVVLKLDFGSGNNPREGFDGVDLYAPTAKYKVNLFKFPYPWDDNSVDEINCSHFVEHVPQKMRWKFFEECWRILKPGGKMFVVVPNWKSERSYGDITHEWPPVTAMSFAYLGKDWRTQNGLTYGPYDIKCNFDWQCGASGLSPQFAQRSYDAQVFASNHYAESFMDMWAVLTKKV